jgi:hypothetical protein
MMGLRFIPSYLIGKELSKGYASEVLERRRVVLKYASRGLVSDEPTQISACAVGKQP